MSQCPKIVFREYRPGDFGFVFGLKNEAAVRANSRRTTPYTEDEFKEKLTEWLSAKLYRIAEIDGTSIGQMLMVLRADGNYGIPYTLAPEHRGRGIGTVMVRQFIEEFNIDTKQLTLSIKEGNEPSEYLARRLGFKQYPNRGKVLEIGQPPIHEWFYAHSSDSV